VKFDGSFSRVRENLREYIHNNGKKMLTFAKESPNAKTTIKEKEN
jgi:hypothetical protein